MKRSLEKSNPEEKVDDSDRKKKKARAGGGQEVDEYPVTSLAEFDVTEELNYKPGDFLFLAGRFHSGAPKDVAGEEAIVKIRTTGVPNLAKFEAAKPDMDLSCRGSNGAWGSLQATTDQPSLNIDVFTPALLCKGKEETTKQLERQKKRLRRKKSFVVVETPEMYEEKAKPVIDAIPASDVEWVHNITDHIKDEPATQYDLTHGKTVEKVVYSDPHKDNGFALLVDFKWKRHPKTMEGNALSTVDSIGLYCIAFPNTRDIRSMRDLRGAHLPLLRAIRDQGRAKLLELYGVTADKLRVFVHYYPQFYHFHVHFCGVGVDYGLFFDRARSLDEIIRNLELDSEYYAKCCITTSVLAGTALCDALLPGAGAEEEKASI